MARRRTGSDAELLDAEQAASAALTFLELADRARELGERDIVMSALKRARIILRRRLLTEDENEPA